MSVYICFEVHKNKVKMASGFNKFLQTGTGSSGLLDGTSALNASTITANNLLASLPCKTDVSRIIQSTLLDIADTNGLQAALDSNLDSSSIPSVDNRVVVFDGTTGGLIKQDTNAVINTGALSGLLSYNQTTGTFSVTGSSGITFTANTNNVALTSTLGSINLTSEGVLSIVGDAESNAAVRLIAPRSAKSRMLPRSRPT